MVGVNTSNVKIIVLMKIKSQWFCHATLVVIAALFYSPAWSHAQNGIRDAAAMLPDKQTIGRLIFHDAGLSNPIGQSCASCHKAELAFADNAAVSEGAAKGAFVRRNAPSLKYSHFSGPFTDLGWGNLKGGFFWDGRANTLQEQALGPLYNPLEMNTTPAKLAAALKASSYFEWLVQHYGEAIKSDDERLINAALDAIADFQSSELFSPFNSKYDYAEAGIIELSSSEKRGQELFKNKALCADCHWSDGESFGGRQLFTGFVYHNIGVPSNPALPVFNVSSRSAINKASFVDGGITTNPKFPNDYLPKMAGAFKTPTLRNIELTAPYMHNGVFTNLEQVVDFYNDMEKFWPPEVKNLSGLVSTKLELTDQEKLDLIAFMRALTDGYKVSPKSERGLNHCNALSGEQAANDLGKYKNSKKGVFCD